MKAPSLRLGPLAWAAFALQWAAIAAGATLEPSEGLQARMSGGSMPAAAAAAAAAARPLSRQRRSHAHRLPCR